MKKLMMAMAMAVGLTAFAGSQNDKMISFSTSGISYYRDGLTKIVDNECFALVWIKDGAEFGGFDADGTLKDTTNNKLVRVGNFAQDGRCPPITFVIPADQVETIYAGGAFAVYLLDTRDANGQPTVAQNNAVGRVNWFSACDNAGTEVDAAEDVGKAFESYVCTYSDGKVVLKDERCLLVRIAAGAEFRGLQWNGELVDESVNTIVSDPPFLADANGKFAIDLGAAENGYGYELIVLDTRLPNGSKLASEIGEPLVGAYGEFILNDDGSIGSIRWNRVKMGLSATYPECGHDFTYDPSVNVEQGYAVVSPADGKWQVYKLPEAWVEPYVAPKLVKDDNYHHLRTETDVPAEGFELESAYKFSAFDTSLEDVALRYLQYGEAGLKSAEEGEAVNAWYQQVQPFWGWNADFEVTFDRDVKADSVILAGFYHYTQAWGDKYTFDWVKGETDPWVGSSPTNDIKAGDAPLRLLASYIGKAGQVTMTYEEVCTKVVQFLCGVKNLSPENYGTTMTVKLCIYENTGRCRESGRRVVIGTYNYTFCGPLDITFKKGYEWPADATLPEPNPMSTNHNGRLSFVLPAPKYTEKHDDLAFVGWSNDVDKTIMTYIPTNTWKTYELYGTWKSAQTVVINPDTNKTENVASIKVADDWLEENNLKDATPDQVAATLQKPAADGGKIPLWQTYVLGLNPSGTVTVVATEKLSEDKALVVSTVEAPAPDAGFKVTYSLDKIDKTSEEPIDDAHKGKEQETKDISIDLEPQGGETPTGYYKMNVFITPVENGKEQEKVQVKSEVTVGVLTVKTEEPVVPVAIPWTSLAETPDENAEIPADEIVQPQGLTDGDQLFVYDRQGEVYTTLTLTGGKWVADGQTVPVDETGTAEEPTQAGVVPTVKRGYGMWLKRQDPSKSFHLFGQYNKTAEKTKIVPPAVGQDKAEYNLIAPTGIEDTDLNSIPSLGTGADPKDKLMIVENGVPTYYNFNGDTKKWGYNKQEIVTRTVGGRTVTGVRTKRVEEAVNVPAGTGLWYISKGGEPEIDWNAKKGE